MWTAQSWYPDYHSRDEGLASAVLDPRSCTFVIQLFNRSTGLTLKDFYVINYGTAENSRRLLETQLTSIMKTLNAHRHNGKHVTFKLVNGPCWHRCSKSL